MKKIYFKPECEAFLTEEELLAPGSIKNPSGIVTETPENTGDITNPFDSPDIDNTGGEGDGGLD